MINMQYSQRYPAKFPAWRLVTYGRPVSLLPLSRSKPAGMRFTWPFSNFRFYSLIFWELGTGPVFERLSGLVILFDFSPHILVGFWL